ncbi:DUF4241 domain-containing protein [Actinophytocola sp.]|uniref:DUF4241 domain-containing protein n=1 Tax=Actinophytocola sp. TaxID=1872138 RepID=UPI002ECFC979
MDARLTRRTVIMSGALAAVTAGGLLALSRARESRTALPGAPDLDNLPVADVPAPTGQPVEIVYCAGWDATTRAPVSPMAESVARAQDAAGAQYAAVLRVDGAVRAVVEVCWSAHHAEVWNIDAAGRRYRGVAYRRWPDGRLRLFGVRSWNYPEPDTPELDGEEPTFQARVTRDGIGATETIEIVAVQADGSTLQIHRAWSEWPEQQRPPENVAVPSVESWPSLAGMAGPVTVRTGPAVVPTEFPWRPPQPLRPRNLTELLAGARFRTSDGRVLTVERIPADPVRLPSGRLLVADPGLLGTTDPGALVATVPPGEYPVEVFQAKENGTSVAWNVACRVTVTGAPVASWHLALREGDDELALGDGEFFGNPVDGATLALFDPTGVKAYAQAEIEDAFATDRVTLSDPATGTNMIMVSTGGDGAFPVWLGRAEDGAISCFVLDFLDNDLVTATPD